MRPGLTVMAGLVSEISQRNVWKKLFGHYECNNEMLFSYWLGKLLRHLAKVLPICAGDSIPSWCMEIGRSAWDQSSATYKETQRRRDHCWAVCHKPGLILQQIYILVSKTDDYATAPVDFYCWVTLLDLKVTATILQEHQTSLASIWWGLLFAGAEDGRGV